MSDHATDSVRRYLVARAATPTPLHPMVLLLEPGGRIVLTNPTARRLIGRDDIAWIFWDRVLASADDAHRVRDCIRAAFREPGVPQECLAQMHGAGRLTFRTTTLSADSALLIAHAEQGPEAPEDLSGDELFDRCSLDRVDGEGSLLDEVGIDQRMSLVRSLVAVDGESLAGPFYAGPGAPAFCLSIRETAIHGRPALAARSLP